MAVDEFYQVDGEGLKGLEGVDLNQLPQVIQEDGQDFYHWQCDQGA